jgi:hypothetical protein
MPIVPYMDPDFQSEVVEPSKPTQLLAKLSVASRQRSQPSAGSKRPDPTLKPPRRMKGLLSGG